MRNASRKASGSFYVNNSARGVARLVALLSHIEISSPYYPTEQPGNVAPTRGRGLKLPTLRDNLCRRWGRPHTGAWIETPVHDDRRGACL